MGFWANQTRSVIEWKDASPDLLIWRWDGTNDELKNCSKLIVNPGQAAIFVYEGEIKAIHDYPGKFELKTANTPFLTTLSNIMQNFTSEHKANVYFVRITEFVNQKWGTKTPVKYEDPVYKFPVGMRAFGNFSFHITNVRDFFVNFSSNTEYVPIDAIRANINSRILEPMTEIFAKSGFSYAEIDKNRTVLSKMVAETVAPEFAKLGFEMSDFRLESTDFDEKTQERIDKISDKMADVHAINALGGVNQGSMGNYAAVEQLRALNTAAGNTNGAAGMGIGMGAGFGLGAGMNFGSMGGIVQNQTPQVPTTACKGCGIQIKATAKFCPECGKPNVAEQTATCVSCKAQIKAGAKFCPECGKPQQQESKPCSKCGANVEGKFCPECGEAM